MRGEYKRVGTSQNTYNSECNKGGASVQVQAAPIPVIDEFSPYPVELKQKYGMFDECLNCFGLGQHMPSQLTLLFAS